MRESDIERYLVAQVQKLGGDQYKFTSPGRSGMPDRICVYEGVVVFVEIKAPGKKLSDNQEREHSRLLAQRANVVVLDSLELVDQFVEALKTAKENFL